MSDGKEYHASYTEFSKTLRAWLVAYGVGGPLVVLSQDHLWLKLEATPERAKCLAVLFLLGVLLQVASALLYKWAMWEKYLTSIKEKSPDCLTSAATFLSKQYIIDVFVDVGSFALFGFATLGLLGILLT